MDIGEDDVPPPQPALQLLSGWDTPGKRHTLILARHVKDEIKKKIWANPYVNLSDFLDKDKDQQPLHVTQSNTGLPTFKKAKINKVDG